MHLRVLYMYIYNNNIKERYILKRRIVSLGAKRIGNRRRTKKKHENCEKCLVKVRILGTSPKPFTLTLTMSRNSQCSGNATANTHALVYVMKREATATATTAAAAVAPLITIISVPLSNSQTLSERWRKRKN